MHVKHVRLFSILGGLLILALASFWVLSALEDNIVFFRTPGELTMDEKQSDKFMRIGGLVKQASVMRQGTQTRFIITDLAGEIEVSFIGLLPDLFREGQGVVAEGRFNTDNLFIAETVLAKHDETYMPPEVAAALKASGQWKGMEQETGGDKLSYE